MVKQAARQARRMAAAAAVAARWAALPPEARDNRPLASLTFTAETIWLTRFDDQGLAMSTYPVRSGDCAGAFRGQAGVSVSTGILPPDTLFVRQQFGAGPRVGLWLPAGVRTIHWAAGKRVRALRLPLPGLVLVGQGTRFWAWAATARPAKESDALLRAPLPNINSDGLICQGNVEFPKAFPDSMPAAASAFLDSQFNADLSAGKVKDQPKSLLAFLDGLARNRARSFPAAQLLPAGLSMGQAISGQHGPMGGPAGRDDTEDEDGQLDHETAETDPYDVLDEGEEYRDEMMAQQAEAMS